MDIEIENIENLKNNDDAIENVSLSYSIVCIFSFIDWTSTDNFSEALLSFFCFAMPNSFDNSFLLV